MEEFKFVLKCFLISCVIVVFSQTRISGETLENKAFVFLQHSDTAQWVRDAADGGIKMIRQGANITKNFISDKFGNSGSSLGSNSNYAARRAAAQPVQPQDPNTGLFRKIDRTQHAAVQQQQPQQRGISAEADLENSEQESSVDDQY